jgi:hypothetical protein
MPNLGHPDIVFTLVIGERNTRIGHEPQGFLLKVQ